jgi:hypothetical protein
VRPRRGAALAIALASCSAAFPGLAQEAPSPPEAIEAPAEATPAIGSGPYRYQLTLRGQGGEAQARMPFALSLNKGVLPFVAEDKNVWRGVTDDDGRTPVFALPDRIDPKDVFLRPRFGDGPMGEQMRFVSQGDDQPLVIPYRLVLCTKPPQQFVGMSDGDGFTAYAASSTSARLLAYALDDDPDFIGRDGDLFWNDDADSDPDPLPPETIKARAKQLKANRKACRKN